MTGKRPATGETQTGHFVDCILKIRYEDLPPAAIEVSKQVMLDGLGVTVAGADEPSGIGRIAKQYAQDMGGAPESTVITGGFKTSMSMAAFVNGTLNHALDFDNTWYPMNHPTSPTLPAILAVAEKHKFSGRQVIEAIVTAFEVQGRIRLAATGWGIGKGFHKPGVTGIMGATAAVAKLLGLNRHQLLMAFGLAGSRAGGLSVNTGTMTKSSHSGQAARSGVECAVLASMGWTATDDIFGPDGLLDAFTGTDNKPELLTEGFGDPYRMVSPGVGFKKYPSSYATHRSIDAALALRAESGIAAADIKHVTIVFPDWSHVSRPKPESGLDGKFSVQYVTALALLDGEVTIGSFTDARRFAPDVEDLLSRVELVVDRNIPADMDTMYTEVQVTLKNGKKFAKTTRELSGWVGQPLHPDRIAAKFFGCVRDRLEESRASRVADLVQGLEKQPDICGILEHLR
ncbi:MAG TPA: MmgE/PrpD family protein [Dongiaceae bacterium]